MILEFTLGDLPLDKSEVSALFSVTDKQPTISVDITKHVDQALFDSKKLFNLSVQQRNPQLATLAAKLAIYKPAKPRRSYRKTGYKAANQQEVNPLSIDEALNMFMTNQSLKTTGAAMLLLMCSKGDKATLKQTAAAMVNMLDHRLLTPSADCFRGFHRNEMGFYEPTLREPGVARSACYHTSPMYTALRDGLSLLVRSGLATMEEKTSVGSETKELVGQAQLLRRKVYHVGLTDTGIQVVHMWGDVEDYIDNFWTKRVG
jgi:hypothetical protein